MTPIILAVDDEINHLHLLEAILRAEGFKVLTVEDGGQALDVAKSHHPDLILLDIAMPNMNGWEVFQRLRADTATRSTPVLVVTARAQKSDLERGAAMGVDDYITKPFDPGDLVARVKSVLGRARRHAPSAN